MLGSLYGCILGYILDLIFGDPHWMVCHPARLIGTLISKGEKVCRKLFPKSNKGQFVAGMVLSIFVIFVSTGISMVLLYGGYRIHFYVGVAVEGVLCYFLFATKSLKVESMKVYDALKAGDLQKSRYAVSMIVGRDVNSLDEQGVAKAAVETVAENTSDGIIAPLFYMILGGAPMGYFYKAINTMDSMIGYKNDRYLYFGRFAAKLDDVVNFIPARLSAMLMLLAATIMPGFSGKDALKIYQRDRKKSASPNAAQTESVCAGALQVQLLGDAYYFGTLHKKDTIGDGKRTVTPERIVEANRLLYGTVFWGMLLFCGIKAWILIAA